MGAGAHCKPVRKPDMTKPYRASLAAWLVKNLPAVQETQVTSLGQEDLLEKQKAMHSSIPAWNRVAESQT